MDFAVWLYPWRRHGYREAHDELCRGTLVTSLPGDAVYLGSLCRGKYRTILMVFSNTLWPVRAALLALEAHRRVFLYRFTGVARLTLHLAQETSRTASRQSMRVFRRVYARPARAVRSHASA
jgi:hypothetical protein